MNLMIHANTRNEIIITNAFGTESFVSCLLRVMNMSERATEQKTTSSSNIEQQQQQQNENEQDRNNHS